MALAAVVVTSPLAAQVTGATVSGKITDSLGAVVPKATIDLLRDATGTHTDVMSNETGDYTVPNLVPGTYTITVTAPTFSVAVAKGLTLTVGESAEPV